MQRYRLLGHPLGHSLSPQIHQRLFAMEGMDADYSLMDLPPDSLKAHLPELFSLRGFNITIPYKQTILPYLDECSDGAALYGAVNTVSIENGKKIGHNTDQGGFLRTMQGHGISLKTRVCVAGAGGVGRMFAIESILHGAEVTIGVRNKSLQKAELLAAEILQKTGKAVRVCDLAKLNEPFGLLINATPVGMFPKTDASPVLRSMAAKADAIFDCIYNPRETLLLTQAKQDGVTHCIGGMEMLVWQAAIAHEIWHGSRFSTAQIDCIVQEMFQLLIEREGTPK